MREGNAAPGDQPGAPRDVGPGTIALLVAATMGAGFTTIVPTAFTLALRVEEIAPGREGLLGLVLGMSAIVAIIANPLTGTLSDRTRTRWGRRRPFTVGGALLGVAALPLVLVATDLPGLVIGWVLVSLGFGTAASSIGNFQADALPPRQRGRVSGLVTLAMQAAPVLGILLAGSVAADPVWVFVLPTGVGVVMLLAFVVFVPEPDSRSLAPGPRLTFGALVRSYGFDPRQHPAFAWNWLGRFFVFAAFALTSGFGAFFYAQRLSLPVTEVAAVVALTSSFSLISAVIGSVGVGWLSDRLGGRRVFVAAAAGCIAAGYAVSASAWTLPQLLVGAFVTSFGIAVFLAVSQAMTLDVLPGGSSEAGRYMAVGRFAQKVPAALSPLLAPLLLAAGGGAANFTLLYGVAAAAAVAGGLILLLGARPRPAQPPLD